MGWFVLSLFGALSGVRIVAEIWVPVLLATSVLAMVAFLWVRRKFAWERRPWIGTLILGLALSLGITAASLQRYQEFERLERRVKRGDVEWIRGPVTEVRPYAGGRIALGIGADPVVRVRSRWHIRLIAEPEHLVAALEANPPDALGRVRLPARLYPFLEPGNPGEFNRRKWALSQGYLATGYLEFAQEPNGAGNEPDEGRHTGLCTRWPQIESMLANALTPLQKVAWRWRCTLASEAASPQEALSLAMVLGQKDLITPEWRERFSRAGIAHLLAVSGLHVGFVLIFLTPVVGVVRRLAPWARLLQWLLPASMVLAFVALAGSPASALRAGIIAVSVHLARAFGRRASSWQMLGLAGMTLLAFNPHYVFDLGFQLSFLATAGIIAVAAPTVRIAQRTIQARGVVGRSATALAGSLAVSAVAQGATLPLVASGFSFVSWTSPATNLVAVPLGALVVLFSLLGLLVNDVTPSLGGFLISTGHRCAALVLRVAEFGAHHGSVEVAMPTALIPFAWYVVLIGILSLLRGFAREGGGSLILFGRRLVAVGAVTMVVGGVHPTLKSLQGVVDVWVIDVGQGDSVLIRAPWGRHVLVDGGGVTGRAAASGYDIGKERVVPALRRLGVRRIDVVVNTHPHADHVQGLAAVVEQREVGRVFASWVTSDTYSYHRFVEVVQQRGLEVERLRTGERIRLSRDVTLRVLASGSLNEWDADSQIFPSLNNRSVALVLETKNLRFLLLGDSEEPAVRRILEREEALSSVAMLVPHHGGRLPVIPELLRAVQPQVAVVSVGAGNPFGHPAEDVLNALRAERVELFRTDQRGAILLELWPRGVRVRTVRGDGNSYK